jgi:hypothetical protein
MKYMIECEKKMSAHIYSLEVPEIVNTTIFFCQNQNAKQHIILSFTNQYAVNTPLQIFQLVQCP